MTKEEDGIAAHRAENERRRRTDRIIHICAGMFVGAILFGFGFLAREWWP